MTNEETRADYVQAHAEHVSTHARPQAYDRGGGCDGEGSDACPHPAPHTVHHNGNIWHFCDYHLKQWYDSMNHVHVLPPDDTDGAPDECECGQLLCPDTETPVGYDSETGEYWHLDNTACFLHQVIRETTP